MTFFRAECAQEDKGAMGMFNDVEGCSLPTRIVDVLVFTIVVLTPRPLVGKAIWVIYVGDHVP